jgi:hypothetical protein
MQWLGVLVLIGLVVIAIKTIWPFLLAALLMWAFFGLYDVAHRKWEHRVRKPKLSFAERRRMRMHQRRGDPENFLSDSQLRIRADAAYRKFLRGQDDGGLPPFNPIETGETNGIEDRSHGTQPKAQRRGKRHQAGVVRSRRPSHPPR